MAGMAYQTAPIALIAFIPFAIALFSRLPGRRAAFICLIGGTLFLPSYTIHTSALPGIPDYTKNAAISLGVLLGILLYDRNQLTSIRVSWLDLPICALIVFPFASNLVNGLGPYNAIWSTWNTLTSTLIPYVVGRAYLNSPQAFRELIITIIGFGLLYVPLILLEMRISPQLHKMVYGFFPHSFAQTMRFGSWRPQVFFKHGLGLASWLAVAATAAIHVTRTGSTTKIGPVPMRWVNTVLGLSMLGMRSVNGYTLLAWGASISLSRSRKYYHTLIIATLLAPACYIGLRTIPRWDGSALGTSLEELLPTARIASLNTRLNMEEILVDHALDKPLLGWGGQGGNRPGLSTGEYIYTITDSYWILLVGNYGMLTLASWLILKIVPSIITLRIMARRSLPIIERGPIEAAILMVALNTIDLMFNTGHLPVIVAASGGLTTLAISTQWATAKNKIATPAQTPSPRLV